MDKYDEQIKCLTQEYQEWAAETDGDGHYSENPLYKEWNRGVGLFKTLYEPYKLSGCITQIKYKQAGPSNEETSEYQCFSENLTIKIRKDDRIPRPEELRPEHLEVFAEYQREHDDLIKNYLKTDWY